MLTTLSQRLLTILIGLLAVPSLATAGPIVFSDSGPDAVSIQGTVDAFRAAIGGVNNGNAPGPLESGRREINWDGGGAAAPVLTDMPKDLFKPNRGAFFGPETTTFSISGAPNPRFGNINPTYPNTFTTFSDPRLFSPTNSLVTEQIFFVPGTNIPAFTTAFGAVFTNVELANTTSIAYFGVVDEPLGKFFVPTSNTGGLSFLGVQFDAGEEIHKVSITTGNTILGPNNGGGINVVVMDDLVYAEPQPIPEASTLLLLGSGLIGVSVLRRKKSSGV
jgi:hypothetical protein